ncbi:MAG TPA: DNA translocase FtsK [Pyrinomonadaceae bacterium]|jgi:serine/threonine protein kinase
MNRPVLTPETILQARYRILRLLGRGGMGTVYEALDERLSRRVALKETRMQSEELRRAFTREASLLANLLHPVLPRVLDHFNEGAGQYIVMEFIGGDDLGKVLAARSQPFAYTEVLRWAEQLLDALQYLHGHVPPVVHRDIKPANLKLTSKGGIILLDFGLAKGAAGEMTKGGDSRSVAGYSQNYAALEQIQGERTSPQSDLYALAATLYHLITKRPPADALKRATAVINGEPDPLIWVHNLVPEVPPRIADVLTRALALQPTRRPASAAVMRAELYSAQPEKSSPASSPTEETAPNNYDDERTAVRAPARPEAPQQLTLLLQREPPAHAATSETLTQVAAPAANTLGGYRLPPVELLNAQAGDAGQSDEELRRNAIRLAEMFAALNVKGQIVYIKPGPVLTTYEFMPAPGVKYSRVVSLTDDICMTLRAPYAHVERVRGAATVGIQIPNARRETINLRGIIESRPFNESSAKLTVAFGLMVDGAYYLVNLGRLPHLLVAGATGSGKSVFLHALILSLLYKARPDEAKLILLDPKRVELNLYGGIPHLATPIITDPRRAASVLKWAVAETERRYQLIAAWGARTADEFNGEVVRRNAAEHYDEHGAPWPTLPYLVIVIDELAELMQTNPAEVEEALTALARKERVVGIHLVIATQRPSADVLTGPIKANFPARVSFHVTSKLDSRVILDETGAEQLLGQGDMLYRPPQQSLVRLHGAYVDEAEIGRVVAFVRAQAAPVAEPTIEMSAGAERASDDKDQRDELFEAALRVCVELKRASTAVLQRRLRIGYGRAAALLEGMEREGYLGPAEGARPRAVLGRAYEAVARWEASERRAAASEETPSSARSMLAAAVADEKPVTAAERIAEFMRETEPEHSAPAGGSTETDTAAEAPRQAQKRKKGWLANLFGTDND